MVVNGTTSVDATATLIVTHGGVVSLNETNFNVASGKSFKEYIGVSSLDAGHEEITVNVDPENAAGAQNAFVKILAMHSYEVQVTSVVLGWLYFAAWSVSFYPQMYINWQRKSVIGLNFDFVYLNIIGFTLYSMYNCGLYFSVALQGAYFEKYPRGGIPVKLNDVVFGLHAMLATGTTIVQCWIYEKGEQRVSLTARIIMGIFALFLTISAILSGTQVITWLDFLYYCSYVKLTITLIKYVPQAYMNYKRKSTIGWSIGNIFLDFTGGSLSMLQMILNAYNENDWASLFGDPTKFGLGLFSVVFDLFFIFQHYVLYRYVFQLTKHFLSSLHCFVFLFHFTEGDSTKLIFFPLA
ncbi:hypothetical protein B566_EDAN005617 [Ephemera danica]|nr:hypothetical protein B566_EDAN005617 [Ephemera danica]